jgi:hypothetical protein
MAKTKPLHLPVISVGAEHMVMGYLMRRNILAYQAPPINEGYDLICIHPDPRRKSRKGKAQVKVQVKSRYATDANVIGVKANSLSAFDFLVVAFLNIGKFYGGEDGLIGDAPPEFYTFPRKCVRSGRWHIPRRGHGSKRFEKFKNEAGFEQIAEVLNIPKPRRSSAR